MLLPQEMLINKKSKKLCYLNLLDANIVKSDFFVNNNAFLLKAKKNVVSFCNVK